MIRLRRVAKSLHWDLFRRSGARAPSVRKFCLFFFAKIILDLYLIIGFEMWQKLAVRKHDLTGCINWQSLSGVKFYFSYFQAGTVNKKSYSSMKLTKIKHNSCIFIREK